MNQATPTIIDLSNPVNGGLHHKLHSLQSEVQSINNDLATKPGLSSIQCMNLRDLRADTNKTIKALESFERFNDSFGQFPLSVVACCIPWTCGGICFCVNCIV